MLENLILFVAIGGPAGGLAAYALRRLGAVHAAELILKTGGEGATRDARPAT